MFKLDFLIIGAQKSGTTSLRSFLGAFDEEIYISNREHHFWNRDGQYQDGLGLNEYQANFQTSRSPQIVGEKSPSYLPSKKAPGRIACHFPDVKLIAILRNPIERAYSGYWHGRRVGAISNRESFGDVIRSSGANTNKPYGDLVTPGMYSRHIANYLNHFPLSQLHILEFDQLRKDSDRHLRSTLEFLGVDGAPLASDAPFELPKRNVARAPRFDSFSRWIHETRLLSRDRKSQLLKRNLKTFDVPQILEADRQYLLEIYADEPGKINALTGMTMRWFD